MVFPSAETETAVRHLLVAAAQQPERVPVDRVKVDLAGKDRRDAGVARNLVADGGRVQHLGPVDQDRFDRRVAAVDRHLDAACVCAKETTPGPAFCCHPIRP